MSPIRRRQTTPPRTTVDRFSPRNWDRHWLDVHECGAESRNQRMELSLLAVVHERVLVDRLDVPHRSPACLLAHHLSNPGLSTRPHRPQAVPPARFELATC